MNKILWKPANTSETHFNKFIDLVNITYDQDLRTYDELYHWTINNISQFWETSLEYSDIEYQGAFKKALDSLHMAPGVKWFTGLNLNFAENLLKYRDDQLSLILI